jgi:hypothetical protein
MARGKQTCKILKEIRKQIAEENDIKLVIEECTYKGDCIGTCPKCEAEVRYLERELEKRQRMGKAAVVAGLSVGLMSSTQVALAQQPDSLNMNQNNLETLRGDVTIVEYGAIPLYPPESFPYHHVLTQEEISQFMVPGMKSLVVVGGDLRRPETTEYDDKGLAAFYRDKSQYNVSDTLFENTVRLHAPQFKGGESVLLEFLSQNLGKNADGNAYGDMEVAFTVEPNGHLSHIDIIKGVNAPLDAQIAALFKFMEWKPAIWELSSGEKIPFACQCVQKLHFPMITH